MAESSSLHTLCTNNLEATQMVTFEEFFSSSQVMHSTPSAPIKAVTTENGATTDCFVNDDFILPDIPDDANDDFSWLFKVLPPTEGRDSYHEVPTGEPTILDPISQENAPPPEEPKSMLVDPMFSEMDVTSLISHDDAENDKITLYKADTNSEEGRTASSEQVKQSLRRSGRAKRSILSQIGNNSMIIDTPMSLRRSQRKRSYQQMIDAEVKRKDSNLNTQEIDKGLSSAGTTKRRKVEDQQTESKSQTDISSPQPKTNPVANNELKILFRWHKPVNPIDRGLMTTNNRYQKGLIDPRRVLTAELYLKHAMSPQVIPVWDEGVPSIVNDNPLASEKIRDLLHVEWIENQNTLANFKAHGKEMLGGKRLTADGKAIRGTFLTLDLDEEYESILQDQNSFECVINWKERLRSKKSHSEFDKSFNLENTLYDFSNFKSFFNEDQTTDDAKLSKVKEKAHKKRFNGIVGAVSVNPLAIPNNSTFSDKWAIFRLKGEYYRPNPAVITIQRVPDHVIEEMQSKPKKVTLQSTYYKALTSYFDKKST